jgi:hypothetical protein
MTVVTNYLQNESCISMHRLIAEGKWYNLWSAKATKQRGYLATQSNLTLEPIAESPGSDSIRDAMSGNRRAFGDLLRT